MPNASLGHEGGLKSALRTLGGLKLALRTLFIAVDRPDMILQAAGGTLALQDSAKFWIVEESELLAAIDFAGDRSAVDWAGFRVADV